MRYPPSILSLTIICAVFIRFLTNLNATTILDFEKYGNTIQVFSEANVKLVDVSGLSTIKIAKEGDYVVRTPSNLVFHILASEVNINLEPQDLSKISSLRFKTRRLKLNEVDAIAQALYPKLSLPLKDYLKWFEELKNNRARGLHSQSLVSNYPAISLVFLKSFHPTEPAVAMFAFQWDEKSTKRRGTAVETNTITNLEFDVPEILASVEKMDDEPLSKVSASPTAEVVKTVEETTTNESATEISFPENPAEASEKAFNWWIWLISLLVLGGIILVFYSHCRTKHER